MPPPKNGSLGRGLGDLLGGVPETIGVAGVPQAPAEKPAVAAVPVQEAVAPPVTAPANMEDEADSPPQALVARPCWNPSRVIMAFSGSLLLVLIGAGIGLWAASRREPQDFSDDSRGQALPAPLVVVTNTVVMPPEPAKPATVDASVFQSLEASDIKVVREGDGAVRLIFNAPVFSSRVVLDPGQASCLDQLGSLMATHSSEWEARVVGHTDAVPLRSSGMYRDNKELGLARAMEVIRYLCRHTDVPVSMLSAATAGEENPPFPGDDPESRLKNRTVTIVIRQISK